MSFFGNLPKTEPIKEEVSEPQKPSYIDPRLIIIDGTGLIKEIPDNHEIKEGKIDMYFNNNIVPYNYDPQTGNIK